MGWGIGVIWRCKLGEKRGMKGLVRRRRVAGFYSPSIDLIQVEDRSSFSSVQRHSA